jgi:hypothetical protein
MYSQAECENIRPLIDKIDIYLSFNIHLQPCQKMITLTTTRFNTKTWDEHECWIEHNNWNGCIYGTPIQVKPEIGETMIVLEMHNDENTIKAIGLLKKHAVRSDKAHQIYKDRNYNRYIYKGQYRLVLENIELAPIEKKIIAIFNQLLFKGACHLKRAQGITAMPSWIMQNKQIDFLKYFKALFIKHYKEEQANEFMLH